MSLRQFLGLIASKLELVCKVPNRSQLNILSCIRLLCSIFRRGLPPPDYRALQLGVVLTVEYEELGQESLNPIAHFWNLVVSRCVEQ